MGSDCIEDKNISVAFILIITSMKVPRRESSVYTWRMYEERERGSRSVIPDPTLLSAALHVIRVFHCTPASSHLQSRCQGANGPVCVCVCVG